MEFCKKKKGEKIKLIYHKLATADNAKIPLTKIAVIDIK